MSEVYAPTANTWSTVSGAIVTGWRNPSISLNGRIYASDCRDGCMLRVYEPATDSWDKFMDSKNHLGNAQAFEAASFVSLNGKLGIIRNNMSISLVDVTEPVNIIETNSARVWEALAGKGQLKNLVASLWSSIAGRNGVKGHIVHCQVLQA
ncbi:hypothetical protein ZIOFF_069114 [Zingiber officinale]|uniref:F-box/kelch-repeat protein n=2 Tax=Zingiber officinale TaxID=94328 RepID=A0A8J5ERG1_ZINOF|nr:hypothetical protein ZIOFF_069114 [Zingiber officinale]